jgi:predicted TIM-barrel fold metal-dependent hydrolase
VKPDDMILVSVDDHAIEPPDMWKGLLPPQWQARAPRLVHKADGSDVWVFEGAQIPNIGLNAVAGRPPDEYGMEPTALSQLRPGNYDVHERVADMNAAGILGSMCFPSMTGFCGELFAKQADKELARVMLQAYNDWHIGGWCGAEPGRFIPLAIPILWDPKLMAEEIRRVARKGCHAISFPDNPTGLGYPSLHNDYWEPVWKAASDEGTVLAIHIGSGTGMKLQDTAAPIEIMIHSTPVSLFGCASELVWSKFLRRYPQLKVALSEGGIGWIPYFLERADYVYKHHRFWTHQDFGKQLPSDVFREHIITCFIDDAAGIESRHRIGVDTITWECDYPHSDTTWPEAPETLARAFAGVPDTEVRKITYENACRHFRFDPFGRRPKERCTVAALRAEAKHVDLAPKSRGGKPPAPEDAPFVTIGHVMKQLASAFATPFESSAPASAGEEALAQAKKRWDRSS